MNMLMLSLVIFQDEKGFEQQFPWAGRNRWKREGRSAGGSEEIIWSLNIGVEDCSLSVNLG